MHVNNWSWDLREQLSVWEDGKCHIAMVTCVHALNQSEAACMSAS